MYAPYQIEFQKKRQIFFITQNGRDITSPWGQKSQIRSDTLKAISELNIPELSQTDLVAVIRACDTCLESYSRCINSYLKMWLHWRKKLTDHLEPCTPMFVTYAVFTPAHALKVLKKSGLINSATYSNLLNESPSIKPQFDLWSRVVFALGNNLNYDIKRVYVNKRKIDRTHVKLNLKDSKVPAHMVIKHDVREKYRKLDKYIPWR